MRGEWQTRAEYDAQQKTCDSGSCPSVDNDMCSYVHIDDFEAMMSSLNIDMLAIFGERDLNVDWRKTRAFYQATVGQNPQATLSITSFPDADHDLNVAETGSIREMQSMKRPRKSDGYYDVQVTWLKKYVLSSRAGEPRP